MPENTELANRQNPDGGWPYRRASSCTEPTVFALLALSAAGESYSPAAQKGLAWLVRAQRPDGGWAPRPTVDQSTWVTALALLLPVPLPNARCEPALRWLADSSGRETSWVERLRAALLGGRFNSPGDSGFPWFPDTAAWVTPSCFGILALEKANRSRASRQWEERCSAARGYLLSHACRDGGWNHGSSKALGYDSDSYAETTGQALLALHKVPAATLRPALERARAHARTCRSSEAMNWLRLGLLAHGQALPDYPVPKGHGSVVEVSLNIVADAAANGRNIFLG